MRQRTTDNSLKLRNDRKRSAMDTEVPLRVLVLASVVLFFMQLSLLGQSPEWYSRVNQIKLLETKRSEVKKFLGRVDSKEPFIGAVGTDIDYEVDRNVSVSVLYSNGYCTPNGKYGYDVEKDTVIQIDIALRKPLEISRFGFDLSRFEKVEIEDVVGLFTYTNEEDGERFSGSATKLSKISLSPSKKQEKLACENR